MGWSGRSGLGQCSPRRTGLSVGVVLLGTALYLGLPLAPAAATGPSYPGETLTLTQSGTATAGTVSNFDASGQQTDVNVDPGGFNLEVFAKPTSVDPTCSPSYLGEEQGLLDDPYEQQIIVGDWQGSGTSFDVAFKYVFPNAGSVTLCAYSTWVTDTAAAATLVANISAATTTTTTPAPPASSALPSKPKDLSKPTVRRSGKKLFCIRGSWQNATHYAYAWLIKGRVRPGATASTLAISHGLKGHGVACRVTASNTDGSGTATSRVLKVR
jgi:hypothetical protein